MAKLRWNGDPSKKSPLPTTRKYRWAFWLLSLYALVTLGLMLYAHI